MIIINDKTNWTQFVPNVLPEEQKIYWNNDNLHFEVMKNYGTTEFHIQRFKYRKQLYKMLRNKWLNEIDTGKISIIPPKGDSNDVGQYRFMFINMDINTVSNSKYVNEVVRCIEAILNQNKTKPINKIKKSTENIISNISNDFTNLKEYCHSDINAAHSLIRAYKYNALNNKHFTVKEYKKFENVLLNYINEHTQEYPAKSQERAWFRAESLYNFINSKGKNIADFTTNDDSFSFRKTVKNHYGNTFTDAIYQKELHWFKEHNKYTWEDPEYKNVELTSKIEEINKPIRDYIKTNNQTEWTKYNLMRQYVFMGKTPNDLDYAKYCSDYIKDNWLNILTAQLKSNWKHWSNL